MSDGVADAVLVLGAAGFFVACAPLARRVWQDRPPGYEDTFRRRWGSGSPAAERAFRRLYPVSVVSMGIVVLAFACTLIPGDGGARAILPAGLLLGAGMLEVLAILVALFNWPKVLAPPHLRSEPGYFKDRRESAPFSPRGEH